jgi:hypothetical protein
MSRATDPRDAGAAGARDRPSPAVLGVDVGERPLLVGAVTGGDTASGREREVCRIDGAGIRETLARLSDRVRELRALPRSPDGVEPALVAVAWERLRDELHGSVQSVFGAVDDLGRTTVLALKRQRRSCPPLWAYRDVDQHGRGGWLVPTLKRILRAEAAAHGVAVVAVDPGGTTGTCHRCGGAIERSEPGSNTVACPAPSCPVTRADRDRSAAFEIAARGGGPSRPGRSRQQVARQDGAAGTLLPSPHLSEEEGGRPIDRDSLMAENSLPSRYR